MDDAAERFEMIEEIRSALSDFVQDEWGLLDGIRDLATGKKTPSEVSADIDRLC